MLYFGTEVVSNTVLAMLALMVGGIIGPRTVPGLTTTSSPFSSANFHAAFSASVLEAGYQTWYNSEITDEIQALQKLHPTYPTDYLQCGTVDVQWVSQADGIIYQIIYDVHYDAIVSKVQS